MNETVDSPSNRSGKNIKMYRCILLLSLAFMLIFPRCSRADPAGDGAQNVRFSYFNRYGADLNALDADISSCATIVHNMPPAPGISAPTAGVLVQGVVGLIDAARQSSYDKINIENCMMFHGWRVVGLSDEEGGKLASLPSDQLSNWVAQWVGAAEPHGSILRSFTNIVMRQPNAMAADWPYKSNISLSEARFDWKSLPPPTVQEDPPTPFWGPKFAKPLDPKRIASQPPGNALIVVRIVRGPGPTGRKLFFSKADVNKTSSDDASPKLFFLMASNVPGEAKTYIFSISPGIWYLHSVVLGNTCLSAPYFKVSDGDVLFLGEFKLGKSLSLDQSQSDAAGDLSPEVADKLKPAHWLNGLRWPCNGIYIVGTQFAGVPFEPFSVP